MIRFYNGFEMHSFPFGCYWKSSSSEDRCVTLKVLNQADEWDVKFKEPLIPVSIQ